MLSAIFCDEGRREKCCGFCVAWRQRGRHGRPGRGYSSDDEAYLEGPVAGPYLREIEESSRPHRQSNA